MESMFSTLKRDGQDLSNANALRLRSRPMGLGHAFEDHGTSLRPSSSQKRNTKGIRSEDSNSVSKPVSSLKYAATRSSSRDHDRSKTNAKKMPRNMNPYDRPTKKSNNYYDDDSDSVDELDSLSSQADPQDDPSTSQKPANKLSKFKPSAEDTPKPKRSRFLAEKDKQKQNQIAESSYIDMTGKKHAYDPKYPPGREKTLAGLKFRKTKMDDTTTNRREDPLPSSSFLASKPNAPLSKENSHHAYIPESKIRKEDNFGDVIHVKHASPLSGKSANSNRRAIARYTSSEQPRSQSSSSSALNSPPPQPVKIGPPKNRPKPRPMVKVHIVAAPARSQTRSKSVIGPLSSQTRSSSSLTNALDMINTEASGNRIKRGRRPSPSSSREGTLSRSSSAEVILRKVAPDPFPHISPTSSPAIRPKPQVSSFPHMSPLGGPMSRADGRAAPRQQSSSSSHALNPFPNLSPPSKPTSKLESSDKIYIKPSNNKGKKKEDNDSLIVVASKKHHDNDNDKETKRNKLKAFPMSTQDLQSIGSPSTQFSSRPGKRTSEGGSGDERIVKKSKNRLETPFQSPTRLPFEDEGDSISISPNVDPRTLCPYCDIPLPKNPTPLLLSLLGAAKKKSTHDPRPSNPLGLKASLAAFIATCQRHRFESQILPEAESKGWPKTIEWKKVGGRITKMKSALKALIEDPGDDVSTDARMSEGEDDRREILFSSKGKEKARQKPTGPKARSIFWTEVMEEIKQKGTRAVAGVRGQFANFEKAQPGYYGELGSVIIHQTLYNMFPPGSMDSTLISPLTANEFVQRILVPEVALRLIMEDKGLYEDGDMQEALSILRESSAYGVAMFPEDGGEWGGAKTKDDEGDKLGVGDLIVMERARKRRKELEEEEKEEERNAASEREKVEKNKDVKRRRKGKAKEPVENSEDQPTPKPVPRPRPIPITSSSTNIVAPSDLRVAPRRPQRRAQSRSRSRSAHMDTDPASGFESTVEISASESDNDRPTNFGGRHRSPSASEAEQQPPIKLTSMRSASRGLAVLNLSSDSDNSSKAVANTERRAWQKPQSSASSAKSTGKAITHGDDSDDAVEVVDSLNAKTPPQTRHVIEIEDGTPRAARSRTGPMQEISSLPPLLRAKARKNNQQFPLTEQKPGPSRPPLPTRRNDYSNKPASSLGDRGYKLEGFLPHEQGGFDWLLSDPSSQ